jgi:hypothetical protein
VQETIRSNVIRKHGRSRSVRDVNRVGRSLGDPSGVRHAGGRRGMGRGGQSGGGSENDTTKQSRGCGILNPSACG